MPGDWKQALEARLADVPKGELFVCAKSDTLFFSPPACACIGQDDKGRLDIWPLYPGVELTLQAYSAKFVAFHHDVPGAPLLEINHCYAGRVGCTSDTGLALYLGAGDLSLHGLHTCVETVMQFPFDGYLGFSFRIDTAQLDANPLKKETGSQKDAIADMQIFRYKIKQKYRWQKIPSAHRANSQKAISHRCFR